MGKDGQGVAIRTLRASRRAHCHAEIAAVGTAGRTLWSDPNALAPSAHPMAL
jgi:hypothetical protein